MELTKNKNRKYKIIKDKLDSLELNESFNVNDFINVKFNDGVINNTTDNYYLRRSFDVMFSIGKKSLLPKEFKCIKGSINRLK